MGTIVNSDYPTDWGNKTIVNYNASTTAPVKWCGPDGKNTMGGIVTFTAAEADKTRCCNTLDDCKRTVQPKVLAGERYQHPTTVYESATIKLTDGNELVFCTAKCGNRFRELSLDPMHDYSTEEVESLMVYNVLHKGVHKYTLRWTEDPQCDGWECNCKSFEYSLKTRSVKGCKHTDWFAASELGLYCPF